MLLKKIKILLVLTLAVVLCCSNILVFANETNTSKEYKSFISYKIDAKLNEKNNTISGREKVDFKNVYNTEMNDIGFNLFADLNNSQETQDKIFEAYNKKIMKENPEKKAEDFLGGIDIKSVKLADSNINLTFKEENQFLEIKLNKPLKNGETIALYIDYEVKIPFGIQRLSYYNGLYTGVHWYPVVAVFNEKTKKWNQVPYSTVLESDYYDTSNYDVTLDVPKDYNVAITGAETFKKEGDRKIVTVKAEKYREMVFFASNKYKKLSDTQDGLTINFYYIPLTSKKDKVIKEYIDRAFKAIKFYSDKFGKYPYSEFDLIESCIEDGALEFTGVVQMGVISENAVVKDHGGFVHEIAHQWFHGVIGNNSETEAVLDEAFAVFTRFYFYNEIHGEDDGFKILLLAADESTDKCINIPNNEAGDEAFYIYYDIGAISLYDLYEKIGEEKFNELMQEYFKEYKFKNATVEGFLDIVKKVCGKDIYTYMDAAWNKPNYKLPEKYKLSPEELDRIYIKSNRDPFINSYEAKMPKACLQEITYRAIEGEKVVLVKSSNLSDKEIQYQNLLIKELEVGYEELGISIEVVEDKAADIAKLKNSNIILLGNSWTNQIYKELAKDIPIKVTHNQFKSDKTIDGNDLYGFYAVKNPLNKKHVLTSLFWTSDNMDVSNFRIVAKRFRGNLTNNCVIYYQYKVYSVDGELLGEKVQ